MRKQSKRAATHDKATLATHNLIHISLRSLNTAQLMTRLIRARACKQPGCSHLQSHLQQQNNNLDQTRRNWSWRRWGGGRLQVSLIIRCQIAAFRGQRQIFLKAAAEVKCYTFKNVIIFVHLLSPRLYLTLLIIAFYSVNILIMSAAWCYSFLNLHAFPWSYN